MANPIDRYLINSPMLPEMKKNADGSLTLYIQQDSPGADRESNWLPAPSDPIYMVMRLYWPKTEAPSILPPGEGTCEPPDIVKARLASHTSNRNVCVLIRSVRPRPLQCRGEFRPILYPDD